MRILSFSDFKFDGWIRMSYLSRLIICRAASDKEQAISQLQSWNLHVFARRVINDDTGEMGNPILPSDVIFVEPPVKA